METNGKGLSSAEHILLEGEDPDLDFDQPESGDPQQHFHVVNRSHAIQTEMILFKGGWLSIRQHKRSKPGEARMINLRFVDPKPIINRYFAKRTFIVSATLGVAGILTAVLAYYSVQIVITIPTAILLLTGAAVAFAVCAYRTRKDVVFVTHHGRAPVIELMGTLGSFRALRRIVPRLIEEIGREYDISSNRQTQLRSEMREHYRLRECGVLSNSECSASTQRILQHFE